VTEEEEEEEQCLFAVESCDLESLARLAHTRSDGRDSTLNQHNQGQGRTRKMEIG
jgi:hypothetical protein